MGLFREWVTTWPNCEQTDRLSSYKYDNFSRNCGQTRCGQTNNCSNLELYLCPITGVGHICVPQPPGLQQPRQRGVTVKTTQEKKKKKGKKKQDSPTQGKKTRRERATWTPSVSVKVNISDIPPGTLVYRGRRS